MAIDPKYGRVTLEKGKIGEDEPVVVFRAQDVMLPQLLSYYNMLCQGASSPQHHIEGILKAQQIVVDWQTENPTKIPTSDSLAKSE